jgi:hypothetical protein
MKLFIALLLVVGTAATAARGPKVSKGPLVTTDTTVKGERGFRPATLPASLPPLTPPPFSPVANPDPELPLRSLARVPQVWP